MRLRTHASFFAVGLALLCVAGPARAATVQAASCDLADVQSAVDGASAGDTVVVPAGTCTWTTPAPYTPSLSLPASITLQGAGIDQTIIDDGTGTNASEDVIDASDGSRITGFTFTDSRSVTDYKSALGVGGKGWRIDHDKFTPTPPRIGITASGAGVIDNNVFVDTSHGVDVFGEGDTSWSTPSAVGTADEVYMEDNTFEYSGLNDGAYDAYDGARYVFRHNAVHGTNVGHHGFDSGGFRSPYSAEIYDNTFENQNASAVFTVMNFRGGSQLIFDNTVSANGASYNGFVIIRNYRSDDGYTSADGNSWDTCNGTSQYDGNTPGGEGYPCRDQIGRGTNQALSPTYLWGNTFKGAPAPGADVEAYDDPTRARTYHILPNRDYYDDTQMPGYTPYTYPHPLRGEASDAGVGGSGGSGGSAGASNTGGSTAGGGGPSSGGANPGGAGGSSGKAGAASDGGDSGCGCTLPRRPAREAWLLAIGLALAVMRRRRAD